MRAVVQRAIDASVTVDGCAVGRIANGLIVYVGVALGDGPADADYLADKVVNLRIFPDESGRMNRSLVDRYGDDPDTGLLAISQFTLLADTRKGRRPSYNAAESPERAVVLFDRFVSEASRRVRVETGRFGEHMHVAYVNDGPVTILVDSRREF
ncbi:MAG: D-tyrosyl-tRNA(Tyr) deacylase [Spirochaetaceae bacterium]|nr:MAG: D-tyrosyl-tRNA(Tyr) deacylase [Spirochaetaceae bacterium]